MGLSWRRLGVIKKAWATGGGGFQCLMGRSWIISGWVLDCFSVSQGSQIEAFVAKISMKARAWFPSPSGALCSSVFDRKSG